MRCLHLNHTHTPHRNNRGNHPHLRPHVKAALPASRSNGHARWHSCGANNGNVSTRRVPRRRQALSTVATTDRVMQTFSIDVKWRMHIVGAIARGVTAAGRTTAMTAIVDGAELLLTFIVSVYYYHSDIRRQPSCSQLPCCSPAKMNETGRFRRSDFTREWSILHVFVVVLPPTIQVRVSVGIMKANFTYRRRTISLWSCTLIYHLTAFPVQGVRARGQLPYPTSCDAQGHLGPWRACPAYNPP